MKLGNFNDQQFQKLKQGFQTGAKSLGVMGEQAFQGLRKTVSEASKRGLIGFGGVNALAKQAEPVTNPGGTFVEPFLKNKGVNPALAFGAGLGIDILAPGPGGEAQDIVRLGRNILSKLAGKESADLPSLIRKFGDVTGNAEAMNSIKTKKALSNYIDNYITKEHGDVDRVVSSFKEEALSKPSSPLAQEVGKVKVVSEIKESGTLHYVDIPNIGRVNAMERGGVLRIVNSGVEDSFKGKGYGKKMYLELLKKSDELGVPLVSDSTVSKEASYIYESLKKDGYNVIKNPLTKQLDSGELYVADGNKINTPVYKILPKKK